MAAVRVQSKDFNTASATSPASIVFTSNVSAGSLLVLLSGQHGAANRVISAVSDNLNGSWTRRVTHGTAGSNAIAEAWSLENSLAGACTVSVTWANGADTKDMLILEYSGMPSSTATDLTDGILEASSTSHNCCTNSNVTSSNGGVLLGVGCLNGGKATLTPGSGYADLGNPDLDVVMLEQITTGSITTTCPFSNTSPRTNNACFVSFKASAAASGGGSDLLGMGPLAGGANLLGNGTLVAE